MDFRSQTDTKSLLNKNEFILERFWENVARPIILNNYTHFQSRVVVFYIVVVLRVVEMICHYKLNITCSCWNNIARVNIHLKGKQIIQYVFLIHH